MLHTVPIKMWLTLCVSALQVGFICVRVPATRGSTEVCTDLPVRGETTSTTRETEAKRAPGERRRHSAVNCI